MAMHVHAVIAIHDHEAANAARSQAVPAKYTGDTRNLNQTAQTVGGPRDVARISSHSGTVNGIRQTEVSTNSGETSTELNDTNVRA